MLFATIDRKLTTITLSTHEATDLLAHALPTRALTANKSPA